MFVGESPQSWVDKPESAAGEQRQEFGQPHVGVEPDASAMQKAEEMNLKIVREPDVSALEDALKVASEEAEDVGVGNFSVDVASADMPNKPIDGDAGEDLDGHGPLLLSHVPPVNPSPRSWSRRSWGDEVEASLGDEVASNDGVPLKWPKSDGSCFVT